jgi:hypothetical protein
VDPGKWILEVLAAMASGALLGVFICCVLGDMESYCWVLASIARI